MEPKQGLMFCILVMNLGIILVIILGATNGEVNATQPDPEIRKSILSANTIPGGGKSNNTLRVVGPPIPPPRKGNVAPKPVQAKKPEVVTGSGGDEKKTMDRPNTDFWVMFFYMVGACGWIGLAGVIIGEWPNIRNNYRHILFTLVTNTDYLEDDLALIRE